MNPASVETVIRTYLEEHVLQQSAAGLTDDTPLLSTGVLTSLTLVRLVAFLESTFDIEVPMQEIVGPRFATTGAIAALVRELRPHEDLVTASPSGTGTRP